MAMLRPVTPFVEYAINYDYIAKVLCINKDKAELECNGKCYVMKQLEKQQENDYKSLRISMEEYPIGFVELLSIKIPKLHTNTLKEPIFYLQNYSYLFDYSVFQPPKHA